MRWRPSAAMARAKLFELEYEDAEVLDQQRPASETGG
jgi:hypothetical protein